MKNVSSELPRKWKVILVFLYVHPMHISTNRKDTITADIFRWRRHNKHLLKIARRRELD